MVNNRFIPWSVVFGGPCCWTHCVFFFNLLKATLFLLFNLFLAYCLVMYYYSSSTWMGSVWNGSFLRCRISLSAYNIHSFLIFCTMHFTFFSHFKRHVERMFRNNEWQYLKECCHKISHYVEHLLNFTPTLNDSLIFI